ncbi:MAG: LL-diaminopimelate aminotransferase [Clostridiales bacterium]|nr:LL-diaminopimelate aminotransferase [Clostridiales bacterium]
MINKNLNKLSEQYLFSEIGKIIKSRQNVINLSVGDVKLPLPSAVVEAGKKAAEELKYKQTFRGYPPETGYDFFKRAVISYYNCRGTIIDESEVFASDGIKSDMSLFLNVIEQGKVLLPSPCYPAYIDANILRGNELEFYDGFPPKAPDIIIICSPDNPTGRAMSRIELTEWVAYARKNNSLILYDAAYEAFITNDAPRSIYEIDGARECAVEFCSLSKTAGFTGVRCGYTIVPKECGLNAAWRRVKSCLSNGVSYITQRMAECALTEALSETMSNVKYYADNAAIMAEALSGAEFSGGQNSPYIWLKCGDSYKEFYKLLDEFGLGVTPGIGFGQGGEGYVRINAFCTRDDAVTAAERLKQYSSLR